MNDIILNHMKINTNKNGLNIFYEKFWEKRNEIFDSIHNILEKEDFGTQQKIQDIITNNNMDLNKKIEEIKSLTYNKYANNYEKYYKKENLALFQLDLIEKSNTFELILLSDEKTDCEEFETSENDINTKYDNNNDKRLIVLFQIQFLIKIKIIGEENESEDEIEDEDEDEEWICNCDYALFILFKVKNLTNVHPSITYSEKDSDSSFSISNCIDIEHLVYIICNKKTIKNYSLIEIDADLNIKKIVWAINTDNSNFDNEYIKYSLKNMKIDKNFIAKINRNNDVFSCFQSLERFIDNKILIFHNTDIMLNYSKINLLNQHYLESDFRFLYLDLNVINLIKNTSEKRKYLSYWIARIYKIHTNFTEDFEEFAHTILKNIRQKNYFEDFIKLILKKNEDLNKNENYKDSELYIIVDNIEKEKDFILIKNYLETLFNNPIKIFGIINIDSTFGKNLFFSLYSKTHIERGYFIHYLYSNNDDVNTNLLNDIDNFFNNLGGGIVILKELIQLINFRDFINECEYENLNFLKKYIKYIQLITSQDTDNQIKIIDINFKTKEIKNKFILNYKNILLTFLNNDIILKQLFSDLNGQFFEKQILLDLLLNKIKNADMKFELLEVHSIYCMNINNFNGDKYKTKNILLIQKSKTGEIFDFGIIIGNSVKLFQATFIKLKNKLIKLDRQVIGVDCVNIKNNLNIIGEFNNFSFSIVTSKSVFLEYQQKNDFDKTAYYLLKQHCIKNKYELLIYDIFEKKMYIEDDKKSLILYENFYFIKEEYKLYIPNIENIFKFKPKKISIKYFNEEKKNELTTKIKNYKIFENLSDIKILGKFVFKDEFIKTNIAEENYGIFISGEKARNIAKKLNKVEILKFGDETIIYEHDSNSTQNLIPKGEDINLKKKGSEVILFSIPNQTKFLGKKRKINKNDI